MGDIVVLRDAKDVGLEAQPGAGDNSQRPGPLEPPHPYARPDLYAARLDVILGVVGVMHDGTYHAALASLGRPSGIRPSIIRRRGLGGRVQFSGTEHCAVADGDMSVTEPDLKRVHETLRAGNIDIVAVHSPITATTPRMLLLHFRGTGSAINLAWTLRRALTRPAGTKVPPPISAPRPSLRPAPVTSMRPTALRPAPMAESA